MSKVANSLNLDKKQFNGVDSVIKLIMIVITITIILFQFSSISGAASAISVAVGTLIGFSSKNTISSAIAGIILLSARPFKLGDGIRSENDSLLGNVVEISLIYTKIKTIQNELVTIPNQSLLQNQIMDLEVIFSSTGRGIH